MCCAAVWLVGDLCGALTAAEALGGGRQFGHNAYSPGLCGARAVTSVTGRGTGEAGDPGPLHPSFSQLTHGCAGAGSHTAQWNCLPPCASACFLCCRANHLRARQPCSVSGSPASSPPRACLCLLLEQVINSPALHGLHSPRVHQPRGQWAVATARSPPLVHVPAGGVLAGLITLIL